MKESKFIDRNSAGWQQFENSLLNKNISPDELERAFLELNDDLAYSRTYFPNRSVRVFLNNMLTPVYDRIYRSRPISGKAVVEFFTQTALRIHWSARRYMLISFITVLLGFLTGFFGTRHDAQFASTVLGSNYVQMTEENIGKGNPMAVYKSDSPGDMFFMICTNNLRVGFAFFFFGALFCVGSIYMLLINGIILGAFTYIFTSRGLTAEYLLTVYQHGTLEILTMVIEGAAGIMLGAGILFPGTLSRTEAFKNAARKSITMFMVCIPIIILAAFIESYLTRFTEIGLLPRLSIILLSLGFLIYYFIFLPWWKFKGNNQLDVKEETNRPRMERLFETGTVYSISALLMMAVSELRKSFGNWFATALALGLGGYFLVIWLGGDGITRDISFQFFSLQEQTSEPETDFFSTSGKLIFWNVYACRYLFDATEFPEAIPVMTVIMFIVFYFLSEIACRISGLKPELSRWLMPALYAICTALLLWLSDELWWPVFWLLWPLLCISTGIFCMNQAKNPFQAVGKTFFDLILRMPGRFFASILLMTLLYFLLMAGLWLIIANLIEFSAPLHNAKISSRGVLKLFVILNYVAWPLILLASGYFYMISGMVMQEIQYGNGLLERIRGIGFKKEVYGVETE